MKSTLLVFLLSCLFLLTLQNSFQCNVPGCQFCSYPNVCGLCQNNNLLMLNTTNGAFYCQAISCPGNCATCYRNNICQTCSSGFNITSNGTCAQNVQTNSPLPPNCLWGINSSNCTLCAYGYSLKAGFCYPTIMKTADDGNCVTKLTSYICQICPPNFLVNPFGKCVPNQLNQTNCNIQNCAFCSSANTTCALCMPGFQLTASNTCTNTTCPQAGCIVCGSNGQCSACAVGYNLNSTSKNCEAVGYGCNDVNCLICSQAQSCGQCKPGYQISPYQTGSTSINICRPLVCPYNVSNCQSCSYTYNSDFNYQKVLCSQCNSGYILVNGYCVAQLMTYGCSVANCNNCSYNNFCSACNPGFTLTSYGTCIPAQCNIPNCATCSLNFICQQCNSGYTLTNAALPSLGTNVFTFAAFALFYQCTPNTISCNVTNCAYCKQANICASCAAGFDFSSSSSNTCVPVCSVTNCLQCNEGNSNTCQYCKPGFQLQSNGSSCESLSFSCNSGCRNNTCVYNWVTNQPQCTGCVSSTSNTLYNGVCYPSTCNIYGCSVCANWENPVYCVECNQGLILSNGYCIKLNCNNSVPNCNACIQNGVCIGCSPGFLLTNSSGTPSCVAVPSASACLVQNCIQCVPGNNQQCSICAQPYNKTTTGLCVCGFQNCLSCKQTGVSCDACPLPLFSSLSTGHCVPAPSLIHTCNVSNCELCLTENQCSVCAVGYSLNSNNLTCFLNNCTSLGLNNCQLCDAVGLVCHLCSPNYMINNFLQGGQCLPINQNYTCNITGCAVCNSTNNSICSSCLPTFYANGPTQCLPNSCNISNCYLCLENNFCTVCLAGYYLTTNLTCQPLFSNLANCQNQIQYCAMCVINLVNNNNQVYCIKCQDGFQFDSTNLVCIPQSNSIPNCKVQTNWGYNMQPYCQVCEQGYFVNSFGLCSQYTAPVNSTSCSVYNCLYCALNNTQCSFCFQPWGLTSSGVCQASVFCPANCQYCVNSSVCLTCMSSYTVNSTNLCALCQVPGCKTCNQNNICATCNSGFTLTSAGICLQCNIANCLTCSNVNYCQTCNSQNGTLQLLPSTNGGSCLSCNTNLPNMANCLSCNTTNSCGQCQNGYQLYTPTNSSTICIQCNIPNCQSCALNSNNTITCQTCAVGYSPVGNTCVQCSYPCTTCNSNPGPNNCLTCSTPFFFNLAANNGSCVANLIPNCVSYNSSNITVCTGCSSGYLVNTTSNTCVLTCPANCRNCTNSMICGTCNSGYFLNNNNGCSQCQVNGCQACTQNGSTCTSCFPGFYLIGSECRTCPGFCSSCSSNSSCSSLVQSNRRVLVQQGQQTLLAVCQQNCITCSNLNPLICVQCASGFYLNQGNCFSCGSNCFSCSPNNSNTCLSCYPNNLLSNGTCRTCSSNCLTCSTNQPSTCLSCPAGSYLSNGQCVQGCSLNCLTCSSSTTCTDCISGYTLFIQGLNTICVPCTTSCRTCAKGQPGVCLSCGVGFYLSGANCVQCSTNCQSCTSSGCISCIEGYFLTSAQTCSQNCQLPCATCSTSNPSKCTSCIAGYSYNDISNSCNNILTCSGGCSFCPLGYSLNQGQCLACTTSQCQSCNPTTPSQCYSCKPGFYLSTQNNQCLPCPSSCSTCLSPGGCLTCATGFTKIANQPVTPNGYQCVPCQSPCATCTNNPNYCTSCVQGYQFFGWKCAQSFYFGFSVTLLTSITTFNLNYYNFILALTNAIGNSNPNSITIISITGGSVIVQGGAGPVGGSGTQQAANEYGSLVATLSQNGQVAGMTIGQSSITVVGGSIDYKKVNLALILGICIPVGVLLIAGIVLYIYCKKKKSAQYIEEKIKEDSGFTVRESFELSSHYKDQQTRRPFEETTGIN